MLLIIRHRLICSLTYWYKNTVGHSLLYMYRVVLTAPNLLTYMLSVSCTVAGLRDMHNDTATEQTPGAYDPMNHGHSIHVVKRVKFQNIAYITFKIVCGWGFTPNPTGRAYTAPSHHLVGCMGIAIYTYTPTTLTTVTLSNQIKSNQIY